MHSGTVGYNTRGLYDALFRVRTFYSSFIRLVTSASPRVDSGIEGTKSSDNSRC